jgi:hypothetical protein
MARGHQGAGVRPLSFDISAICSLDEVEDSELRLDFRINGNFGEFRRTHKKIRPMSVQSKPSLKIPEPRNTLNVQARIGKQVAVREQVTQAECSACRMWPV